MSDPNAFAGDATLAEGPGPGARQPAPYSGTGAYPAQGYQAPASQGPYVGQPMAPQVAYGHNQKSKVAAGLLGIFLGAFGIHNFYLGHTGKALAQLLITILSFGIFSFISGIWGLIEGIIILCSAPGARPWGVDAQGVPLSN
ncbi:TM2 domain-containing protein [Actinomyces marmotae]|uniref:TM2 domain-containing protein n=1 Tax=Actinomyces marmotae TaxID=2737173 RepID=A0A6M8AXV7_9ACTO|nr:TM2 domain-containing protein [Actinomyces marmotae]QKD79044.1 TM2 domain-containing protein [Actinomyces marmotae]